jgi:hypothetical protein
MATKNFLNKKNSEIKLTAEIMDNWLNKSYTFDTFWNEMLKNNYVWEYIFNIKQGF